MAMCPKCATVNENTRLTCFRCGMMLPKLSLEELNTKSEVSVVIDENLKAKDVVKASDCIFLTSLKDIKTRIDEGNWENEEIQAKIDSVKQESNYILDLISSFSDEEKSWMKTGLAKIDSSYDMFQESFGKFEQFLRDKNPSNIEEALTTAGEASHLLLSGINEAQDELGVEEEKLTEELHNIEGKDEPEFEDDGFPTFENEESNEEEFK